jgi:HEAT repeat protein
MTRKRKFLTGSLAVLAIVAVVIPLQHPYVWQSLFGPRIHGYPLWQWQQAYLREIGQPEPDGYLKMVKDFLGIKRPPRGESPLLKMPITRSEAMMVLAGFVDHPDEDVRDWVAHDIGDLISQGTVHFGTRLRVQFHGDTEKNDDVAVAAATELIRLLDDPSPKVRGTAIRSLGWLSGWARSAETKLRQIIDEPDTATRLDAAEALWRITGDWQTAGQVARDALGNPDVDDRRHAVCLLNNIWPHDDRVYHDLVALYETSPHADTRRIALWQLGYSGHAEVIPLLLRALERGQVAEQRLAAQCLSLCGANAQTAVPALERAARSSDANLRRHAIDALSRIDPKRYPDRGGP